MGIVSENIIGTFMTNLHSGMCSGGVCAVIHAIAQILM